jgi:hypothetical protein
MEACGEDGTDTVCSQVLTASPDVEVRGEEFGLVGNVKTAGNVKKGVHSGDEQIFAA